MRCNSGGPFLAEIVIRRPSMLKSLVERVRAAVADDVIEYEAFEPDLELAGQPSIQALYRVGPWPDAMLYHFALSLETYHGAGGSWSRVSGE